MYKFDFSLSLVAVLVSRCKTMVQYILFQVMEERMTV